MQAGNNVSVEYRKRKGKGKRKTCENREKLTRLYAPPSYEVVIGMEGEDPPPYRAVAGDSDASTSDGEDTDTDHVMDINTRPTSSPDRDNIVNEDRQSHPDKNINVVSAIVTCDIEGNHQVVNNDDIHKHECADSTQSFQDLTNLHLCATGPSTRDSPITSGRNVIIKGASRMADEDEIEVIQTSVDHVHKNGSITTNNNTHNGVKSHGENGHSSQSNGVKGKVNGHAVKYKRSPSQFESIDFIDSA